MVFQVNLENESGVSLRKKGSSDKVSSLCPDPATVQRPVGLGYRD